jgi:hypothetical protein
MLSESGASTEPRYSPRLRMMMTHIASMVGGLQRPFDPALLELIAGSATMLHVQGAHDRREEIVEVVCYAPYKLAHGLQLLLRR